MSTSKEKPGFDLAAAHRHFSGACFNATWELIDKTARSAEDEDEMLRRAFASAFHWSQRPDCTATHRSVSYWQLSRVLALARERSLAERYARTCLEVSLTNDLAPFFVAYAYEALARAAALAGRSQDAAGFVARARELAEKVEKIDERQLLLNDLATIT